MEKNPKIKKRRGMFIPDSRVRADKEKITIIMRGIVTRTLTGHSAMEWMISFDRFKCNWSSDLRFKIEKKI